jgi:N4-gp56 family major capsid protein
MSITTTSILPAPVQQSFSYKLLSVPVPNMIHKIPAMLKVMPRNGGTTLRMRRYNPLAVALVPLGNSGVTPPAQNLTAVDIDAKHWGVVKFSLIDLEALRGDRAQA